MHFKLIIAFVNDDVTNAVLDASRVAGAKGATVINNARGEGIQQPHTFFGLSLESQKNVLLLLVEEHLSRNVLETISEEGKFDDAPGTGIAFQIDVEDAVGISHQIAELTETVEEII